MNIEPGDLFAVVRGVELQNIKGMRIESPCEVSVTTDEDAPPRYDRGHANRIYRAVSVCGPFIAARIEYSGSPLYRGSTVMVNSTEVELWPITDQCLKTLKEEKHATL